MGIRDRIKRALPIVGLGGNRGQPAPAAPPTSAAPRPIPTPAAAPAEAPRGGLSADAYVEQLVKGNRLVLFMKGSPSQPQCGFSANAAGILRSYNVQLTHVDVLSDPDIRQAVKDYAQWPTIPQIFIDGEFIGGSDILQQMHASGELAEALAAGPGPAA
jgi:Grx4 family monothiol glutaredoxin